MEVLDIFLTATNDVSYAVVNHPLYAAIGFLVMAACLLRFYCRLTCGMCDCDQDMEGKTVFITGASAGIGKATALDMARRNARVILGCRNLEKARRVANEIISTTSNRNVFVKQLDLTSFDSVRKCAEDVLKTEEKLHVLINNAGIFGERGEVTADGCEKVMQANHLGHFLLTLLLLDLLKKSAPSRIVNVSSDSYKFTKLDVDDMLGRKCSSEVENYGRSKLANVLFTRELASRLRNSGVTVNALHPGAVKTDIMQNARSVVAYISAITFFLLGKSCEEGAQTTIYAAVHPNLDKTTGKYFKDCKEEKLIKQGLDNQLAKRLFEVSEKIVGTTFKS